MNGQTELERWWTNGVPADMFVHGSEVQKDVQTLIGVILNHLAVRK